MRLYCEGVNAVGTTVFRLAGTFLVAVSIGACGSNGISVADVNERGQKVEAALDELLSQGEPADVDNPESWQAFFNEGEANVSRLEDAFDAWSDALDDADPRPPAHLFRYRSALGDYVGILREQATLSRACMPKGDMSREAAQCYQRLVDRKGAEWKAAADRLLEARNGA
jgi:hypothetical protein